MTRYLRHWPLLVIVATAAIFIVWALNLAANAHGAQQLPKRWAVSELFCDGGVSTDWYRTLGREQAEFVLDTQPSFDRQLSAIRELHYRAGRVHVFYALDWPNHCGGRTPSGGRDWWWD